jgi:formylglycine-generating enzyme required for sulfatase activity
VKMKMDRLGQRYEQCTRMLACAAFLACGGDDTLESVFVHVATDAPPEFVDRIRIDVLRPVGSEANRLYGCDYHIGEWAGPDAEASAPVCGTGVPSFWFELRPSSARTLSEVLLLRLRGFSSAKLMSPSAARSARELLRAGPASQPGLGAFCDAGGRELQAGNELTLTSDQELTNVAGWSCDDEKPDTITPVKLSFEEANEYVLTGTSADMVFFLVEHCGTPAVSWRCQKQTLRITPTSSDTVVLVGKSAPREESWSLRLENASRLGASGTRRAEALPPEAGPEEVNEPAPGTSIDRWAMVPLRQPGSLQLTLRASCFGVPADPPEKGNQTCVDSGKLVDIPIEPPVDFSVAVPVAPWEGAGLYECKQTPREGAVCIPGGAFILGDAAGDGSSAGVAIPERIVTLDPFYLDIHEFSVERYEKVRNGEVDFARPSEAMVAADCVSGADGTLPLTCVSWAAARELCQSAGGDLPTAAQWEYAAAATIKPVDGSVRYARDLGTEKRYPWGMTYPPSAKQDTLQRVNARQDEEASDCTSLGVCGLGGNVSEWTIDNYHALPNDCGSGVSSANPACIDGSPLKTVKGGSWARHDETWTLAAARHGEEDAERRDDLGFRCAYPAERGRWIQPSRLSALSPDLREPLPPDGDVSTTEPE